MTRSTRPSAERDALVRWTANIGACTAEALALHLGVSLPSARARLLAAERAGLLAGRRLLYGQPALFTATPAGLRRCCEPGLEPCRVSAPSARHLIVCASVAAALERCYPDHELLGERPLRLHERRHNAPLASVRLGGPGRSALHCPDLVLCPTRPGDGSPVAIEVELTVKAPRRLDDIVLAWARSRHVAGVLYFAPPPVHRALRRAQERAAAHERVVVLPFDALPGLDCDAGLLPRLGPHAAPSAP